MAMVNVNGVGLAYEFHGTAETPLVMVHGSWFSRRVWDPMVPHLAESVRVLTYDRRGHGESERPSGQGSVREDVSDLAALIEDLDLAPAWVAGQSFGGSITLRLAGERPDLLRGITAHEPPVFSLVADDPPDQLAFDLEWISGFTRPALLTQGDRSPPVFPAVITRLAEALPSAEVSRFTGAGHPIHTEQPETYADAITDFVHGHTA